MDSPPVIKHVSADALKHLIRKERDMCMYKRLLFVYRMYQGRTVEEACEDMCISKQTGYNWLKQWNEDDYEGLKRSFSGGRPPKLSREQRARLRDRLSCKGLWLTQEVRAFIRHEFRIDYSLRQVARILKGFRMHYAKPYPRDYRRPENAAEQLAESLKEALDGIGDRFILGFMDESAPQTTDNRQRFWSFGKPAIAKNTTKYRANTFGFYPVNGKEVVEFMEHSRKEHVCEFLRKVRDKNPAKPIVILLDRFASHRAIATRRFAQSLDMHLVFLPPYSPHLNPIEQIWKSVRRAVSRVFPKSEWAFKETIRTAFHRLARMPSFLEGWLKAFQPVLSK